MHVPQTHDFAEQVVGPGTLAHFMAGNVAGAINAIALNPVQVYHNNTYTHTHTRTYIHTYTTHSKENANSMPSSRVNVSMSSCTYTTR